MVNEGLITKEEALLKGGTKTIRYITTPKF